MNTIMSRSLFGFLVCLLLFSLPAFAADSKDSQIFISGFNAYQKKDYQAAIDKMSTVLKNYPDTQLRDMALFWLARSHYKAGNQQDAARYMSQFFREYPDSPLRGTVEDDLVALANAYGKGDKTLVADKADPGKAAREKQAAEARRMAAEKAESERLAREKAEQLAVEREAAAKAAREKSDRERIAAEKALIEKAEAERLALERAEAARLTKLRLEEAQRRAVDEKATKEKVEAERIALEKAEGERLAGVKADEERKRLAAERALQEKAEQERIAAENAALEKEKIARLESEKAETERLARLNAETEERRVAEEKATTEKAAREKAEADRLAARKLEDERIAREKQAAAEKRRVAEKAGAARKQAAAKRKASAPRVETARDKSIAEYKAIIDRAPGSNSAEAASAKLKAMGVEYPAAAAKKAIVAAQPPATSQVLTLEVAQFADVDFSVPTAGQAFPVGRRIMIPFEVVNRGNGNDTYYLESGFPAEYGVQFMDEAAAGVPVNRTPQLEPGQRFKGSMALTIPRGTIDGQKISYPVKLASQYARDVSQSRQVTFIASAPLLRAVINGDRKEVAPGEKATYRVAVLNIGSAAANGVILRLNYPPLYEPVDFMKSGFKQEMKAALLLDGIKLESGESRELTVTFQLKDEAIAKQELFLRGDLVNNDLETSDSFVSAVALVQGISGVTARTTTEKLLVIPGQTVAIPLVVTNTGNQREDFTIRPTLPANLDYTVYLDINRDGIRGSDEPVINHVGPLSPREEAYVVFEVKTPATENDGASTPISVTFEPESNRKKGAMVNVKLAYSRPVVELAMNTARGARLRPGEVTTIDLTCTNRGSGIAKVVEMRSLLPEALELVASDPAVNRGRSGEYVWKFEELGAGEKKGARVSIRVKSGIAVGTNLQVKNLLSYQDQLGNSY